MNGVRCVWLAIAWVVVVGGAGACRTAAFPAPAVIEPVLDLAAPDLVSAPPRPERNSCGGTAALAHEQGTACGPCGFWICDGENADAVRCSDPEPQNACGGCGPAPLEICNGFDDDCDGVVDPGCPRLIENTIGATVDRVRLAAHRVAIETQSDAMPTQYGARVLSLPPLESGKPLDIHELVASEGQRFDLSAKYFVVEGPLRAYDLASAAWVPYQDTSYLVRAPVLHDDEVVFLRDLEIRAWPIGAAETTLLAAMPSTQAPLEVAADGKWLAYVTSDGGGQVVLFDRETKSATPLSRDLPGVNLEVTVRGHRVAWTNSVPSASPGDDPVSSVYVYDLTTQQRERLPYDDLAAPRLSGDLVCAHTAVFWQDAGVYVHNLATGKTTEMAHIAQHCDLDGTRLAWVDAAWPFDARYLEFAPGTF